jgi:RND family efflux transporter MFP subunit
VAKAHVPQSDANQLKVGDPAEIRVPGEDPPVKGRISLVSPALDPGSTTIEVWVETRQANPKLKPGMTVSIEATAKTVPDAVAVPTEAVFKNAEGADYVLIAGADQKAHQKVVETGVKNAKWTEIVSGVEAGESVIVAGGYSVPDGTAIEIEKPGPGDPEGPSRDKTGDPPANEAGRPAKDKE